MVYKKGEKVYCYSEGDFYEARITSVTDDQGSMIYGIHYQGWNKRYDESISEEDAESRIKPFGEKPEESSLKASAVKKIKTPSKPTPKARSATKTRQSTSKATNKNLSSSRPSRKQKSLDFSELIIQEESPQITLNDELAELLRTDADQVNTGKLLNIPVRVNAQQIVNEYKNDVTKRFEDDSDSALNVQLLQLFADGLLDCMDYFLRSSLLYKTEYPAHDKLKSGQAAEFLPRNSYGFIHLLRSCSVLDEFYENLDIHKSIREHSKNYIKDLSAFLLKHLNEYYDASDDYQ